MWRDGEDAGVDTTQIPPQPELGKLLPEYRLVRQLAMTSMSVVYQAKEVALERDVALKVLHPNIAASDAFRRRFDREVTIAAGLSHPNVIPIHAKGERDGVYYVAMHYVDGPTLAQLVRDHGRMELSAIIGIVRQVAAALDAAHREGLVHRDVKPSNVLIDRQAWHAYLGDFGIAKQVSADELTTPGEFLGTVLYAPPEQIRGHELDPRADQYALGCAVYECLTGAPPFPKSDAAAVSWAHFEQSPPRVTDQVSGLSPAVDDAITKALAKCADDRHASCDAFVQALAEASGVRATRGKAIGIPTPSTPPAVIVSGRTQGTVSAVGQSIAVGSDVHGDVRMHHSGDMPVVPRQLVAPSRLFTGRERQLSALARILTKQGGRDATVVISAIGGAGGIGKTALALYWAYQHLAHFPDGQLYVDLCGFAQSAEPMAPSTAMRGFLDALGVEPAAIPVDLDAQAALYRSLVAGKRVLVVLDNARSSEQVKPLLPGSATCAVVVTSRHRLTDLVTRYGAHLLDLDVLTPAEARELLARYIGDDRVVAEPEAVTELVKRCAGLPIAITIVAAHAACHPRFPLATLAERLREESTRLDELEELEEVGDGDELPTSLRAVFSWSTQALTRQQAEVFGLLGLAPGPDISLPAAANLAALPVRQARMVLGALAKASLIEQHAPDRYRLHDLIRLYAAEHAHHDQPVESRTVALRQLVDFYLHTAHTAERLLNPEFDRLDLDPPVPGCHPYPLPDHEAALSWFEAEHPCLLATQHLAAEQGWHAPVWQLARTLGTFHHRRGHLHHDLAVWRIGLAAAEHTGEAGALLRAYRRFGVACARLGWHTDALHHLDRALRLAEEIHDLRARADTHDALSWAWERRGGGDQWALEHATAALHLYQDLDDRVNEADMLSGMGWYSARLGNYEQASTHCEAALTLARRHHDRGVEAATLDSLGYIAHHTGHYTQALDFYHQALTLYRGLGHTYLEADTLDRLGHTHAALNHHDRARHAWHQALKLYQAQHRTTDANRIQHQLDTVRALPHRAE